MSNNKISEQKISGASLFNDSESYLTELDDSELAEVNGGFTPFIAIGARVTVQITRPVTRGIIRWSLNRD